MKRVSIIISIIAVICLSSCDGFRKLAGRPTKAEIEEIRAKVAAQEAENEKEDTVAAEDTTFTYTMTPEDSISLSKEAVIRYSALANIASCEMTSKYYVIIGTFKQEANAQALVNEAKEKGYEASIVDYKTGVVSVGVYKTDNASQLLDCLENIKQESFCPKDYWILINE